MKPELLAEAMTGLLTHLDLTEDEVLRCDIAPRYGRIHLHVAGLDDARQIADRDLDDATYNPVAYTTTTGQQQIHHEWAGTWTTPTGDPVDVDLVAVEILTDTTAGGETP